jgi:hypothetical protein
MWPNTCGKRCVSLFLRRALSYRRNTIHPFRRRARRILSLDSALLARPGNDEMQLDLFLDHASNVALYPKFQKYFRTKRPPILAVSGKNDPFFPPAGALARARPPGRAKQPHLPVGTPDTMRVGRAPLLRRPCFPVAHEHDLAYHASLREQLLRASCLDKRKPLRDERLDLLLS